MKKNNHILKVLFVLVLWPELIFSQFPSTNSYKLCNEIPKAKCVGDTVSVYNCMQSGDHYVLKKIDRKGRYWYKNLGTWKSRTIITYDDSNRVVLYSYKYNSGLWGGSGKGVFIIHYYTNGNIKDFAHIKENNKPGELCQYTAIENKQEDLSKLSSECHFLYKKRNKIIATKKLLVSKKELKDHLKNTLIDKNIKLYKELNYEFIFIKLK